MLADEFSTVSPGSLNLTLVEHETAIVRVSLTIHPFCFRPYNVDVVASAPDVALTNLSGILVNGCGGDTTAFVVELEGDDAPQSFDLQFVDAEFGGVLASIPVAIDQSVPRTEPLMGLAFTKRLILFQVASTGCTTKEDFRVDVLESFPLQLRLVRIEDDPCDAVVPLGTVIRFKYSELGLQQGDRLRVVNPLATIDLSGRP